MIIMKVNQIVRAVNIKLDNANLDFADMSFYFDQAIDHLNTVEFGANFPYITDMGTSDLLNDDVVYDALPDDWIRNFLVPFVAAKLYQQNGQNNQAEVAEFMLFLQRATHHYQIPAGVTKIERVLNNGNQGYKITDSKGNVQIIGQWNPEGHLPERTATSGTQWGGASNYEYMPNDIDVYFPTGSARSDE